ncbi:hypothetical protein T265_06647 [Opisthorchis viverrini]|uniref:Cadherin domain-containing protein n=2 Tax=Opisthorchis viverrini TaxID=6198 RepID=A0A074ZRN8_OPIVI|nr:hypothetical protein T265_06647 [Opisthorchis viverrini]KER26010.1 hypothetical protein T265_06647 [Opisthorchis viverrini]
MNYSGRYCTLLLLVILASCECAEEVQVHLQMREETPPHTRIGSVSSSLPATLGTKLHFLTDNTFFSVAPNTGEVGVARLIDRERLCPDFKICCGVLACQLDASVFITNKETGEFAATVNLKVDIQDQNDNRPAFTSPSQKVAISESALVGTHINLVPATDADIEPVNQIQRYSLIEPTGTFVLDLTELPSVRLQLTRPLDREKTELYTANLEACDPGACARQTLEIQILDENDNKPIFKVTRYKKQLQENIKVGEVVLHLNATDLDAGDRGRVLYALHGTVDPDLFETFELVRDTGEIRLKRPLAANIRDNYRFKVIACDAVNPACAGDENSTAEITLLVEDINNFAPTIHTVAAGAALASANPPPPDFTGQKSSEASFRESLSIFENTPPSQVAVLTVRDADVGENSRVTCSLNESSGDDLNRPFIGGSVSPNFILTLSAPGIYSLRTSRMYDYEIEPVVSTKVVCHDFGKPHALTSARVITVRVVDVNEFQPEFSRRVYVGRVSENSPAGKEILTITATDRDRGAVLRYYFAPVNTEQSTWDESGRSESATAMDDAGLSRIESNKYFVMEPETGVIRTSQIALDRETVVGVTLVVLVSDSTMPPKFTATTTVSIEVIDENDNAPVFVNPPAESSDRVKVKPFTVMENAPRFTRLSEKLEARDPDQGENGRVQFSLLDTYALTRSSRQGSTNIRTNGQYSDSRYKEISHQSDPIDDLGLSKRVVDQPIFRVTPDGVIETLVELDREIVPAYILKVGAQDRGSQPLASTIMLRIDVLDANDNSPVWVFPTPMDRTINLTTAMKPGSLAGRLRAEDADINEAGRVTYLFLGPRGEPLRGVSLGEGLLDSLALVRNGEKPPTNEQQRSALQTGPGRPHENGYRVGPLYLNGTTGEIWIADVLTPGAINLHLRAQDRGKPVSQTDAWLTINVFVDPSDDPSFFNFTGDGTLNVTIILVMITITAIVSLFLIVGIVCVRRRPVRYNATPINTTPNGTTSPGHMTTYSADINKDYMAGTMNTGTWSSPLSVYTAGQYYPTLGSVGNPLLDDGQIFTTIGGAGMMGYGAMVAPSDTASLIYVPQPPPPQSVMGSVAGASVTPVPLEHGVVPLEYTGRGQMNTFGTLNRNRGTLGGGFYTGPPNCGISYEPHLDGDSGDSGRGPSEEGNQFLLTENYRNSSTTAAAPGHYNTYSGYRPSSRAGYYRNGLDGSNGMTGLHALNCPTVCSGGPCACYTLTENSVVQTSVQAYEGAECNSAIFVPSYIAPRSSLDIPLPPPPPPPPRSPVIPGSGIISRKSVFTDEPTAQVHQSQTPDCFMPTSSPFVGTAKQSQNIYSQPPGTNRLPKAASEMNDDLPNGSITPVRIDLRKASLSGLSNGSEEEHKQRGKPAGAVPVLPPLAMKKMETSGMNGEPT